MGYKIYTKGGDKGKTSLIGGARVPKYDERIEAYGTVDELCSFVGLIRDQEIDGHYKSVLLEIQKRLFVIESLLASVSGETASKMPQLKDSDIELLEREIDIMETSLPELRAFIIPGGNQVVSFVHIARTICRRAERLSIKTGEKYHVDDKVIRYLNRLSDYFFVLARKLSVDFDCGETLWNPYE